MKRLALIAAAMMLAFGASAQQKGDSYVGLSLDYNTGKRTLATSTTTTIAGSSSTVNSSTPTNFGDNLGLEFEYGYFVADKLRVGIDLDYTYTKNGSSSHAFGVMPNVAYYVELAKGFYYTPNLGVGFGLNTTPVNNDSNLTMCGFVGEFQPFAVEFRPTKRFAMTVSLCSLQYSYLAGKESSSTDILNSSISTKYNTSTITFDLMTNAQVGFKLYF